MPHIKAQRLRDPVMPAELSELFKAKKSDNETVNVPTTSLKNINSR